MSTTETKRTLAVALRDAEAFRELFMGCYERWEIAGSIRRKRNEVGDAEHVVEPKYAMLPGPDLFGTPERTNLLWKRLDELVAAGELARHQYGNGERWGPKYRGVDRGGVFNEIFTADEKNWGPTLAIRTGSADFSKRLVSGLLRNDHRQKDGQVWRCRRCFCGRKPDCRECDGTALIPVEAIAVADERKYFELCGVGFLQPEARA